ncbi:hypothetical protein GWN26_02170 [Candidatus Saccharibacteria bacterium]|nr:hypothetical protein [Calditrichia bacterium]NIV71469.1 hypothetical protein [Calditrichia bacterium]NIV98007.1 hypothetical protein [Candidatus Saccharibacteria bacterium]NIW78303.1 hypothetical protein [Calditrichia bacterium]
MDKVEKPFVVIIGDVSGSKQLSGRNRYQTQLFLKSAIVQINEEFEGFIEAPLTITKGDEFQGLIKNLEDAFQIILALEKLIFPVKMKFGIGVGKIFKMGGKLPIEMDGPAFHKANRALSHAKKKKYCYSMETDDEALDLLANTIFQLITAIKLRWHERHFRLYWRYKDLGTYREVAALENITPQAVCDTLKNSRALYVKTAEENLIQYFQKSSAQSDQSEALLFEEARSSLR